MIDKTISLWDVCSSLYIQTFYGHQSSCNHAAFDPKGETVVSVDANGISTPPSSLGLIWQINVRWTSGYIIAIASSDNTIKCDSIRSGSFQTYGEVVPIQEFTNVVQLNGARQGFSAALAVGKDDLRRRWWCRQEWGDTTMRVDEWDYILEGTQVHDRFIAFGVANGDVERIEMNCTKVSSFRDHGGSRVEVFKTLDDDLVEGKIKLWGVPKNRIIMDYTKLFESTKGKPKKIRHANLKV
ncbi:hypothetical protein SELMODRAFT_417783 [Selaginella moellendorffii]|uniref:Uncharacterized protein n=1 Tax=Selaginella moellendorffii TaxID=88036 RepID=D8S3L4_SELML|nr:hypothetical protein SELMODRAFT_417783 [Selaginella moellendorffii]